MPQKILFSFEYCLLKCLDKKIQGERFTNQVEKSKSKEWFARLLDTLKVYSQFTLPELEKQQVCYKVKDQKVFNRILAILKTAGYKEVWVTKTLYETHLYKFKPTKKIRLFGFYTGNVLSLLLCDPNHLVEPDDRFGTPKILECTWCLKDCSK